MKAIVRVSFSMILSALLLLSAAGCNKLSIPTRSAEQSPSSSAADSEASGAPGSSFLPNESEASSESSDSVIPNDADGIPDKAFYQAILKTTREDGKTPVDENRDGKLQVSEARSVPYIAHWERKGIRSVQGLDRLSAFEIHLDSNQITDLSPLVKRALKVKTGKDPICAYLSGNKVTGLYSLSSPMLLSGKKGIQIDHLDLSKNEITDVSPLGGLKDTGIKYLDLSRNRIENADALLNGTMFEILDLSHNRIEKIGSCNTDVFYLDLSHNRLESIQSLSGTFLTQLYLSGNDLTDLNFLKGIQGDGTNGKGLLCLDASDNRLSSLPDFKEWGWTNFFPEKDGGTYRVDFRGNRLSENEFKTKMPKAFLTARKTCSNSDTVIDGAKWLKEQVKRQKSV
jgi:Leucine-rich repeat (LRR) protein